MPGHSILTQSKGPLEATFRPTDGGRLASLRYRGIDLVLPAGQVPGFYGDTFWPSPEALFDWPPPPVLDAEPYAIVTDLTNAIILRSAPDPAFGLLVEKRFLLSEDALTIDFTMINIWEEPQTVAPWQVTRAPREGLIIWALGKPFQDADRIQKQNEDPGCWYLHRDCTMAFEGFTTMGEYGCIDVPAVSRTCKLFTDARGWLAHIHHGVLFLRIFPDLKLEEIAPREGEVELYFNPELDYLELENQGTYEALDPGKSLRYPVTWRFAKIDPNLATDRITPELVAAIQALLEVDLARRLASDDPGRSAQGF